MVGRNAVGCAQGKTGRVGEDAGEMRQNARRGRCWIGCNLKAQPYVTGDVWLVHLLPSFSRPTRLQYSRCATAYSFPPCVTISVSIHLRLVFCLGLSPGFYTKPMQRSRSGHRHAFHSS